MKLLIADALGGFLFLGVLAATHSLAAAIAASALVTGALVARRLIRREPVSGLQWATLVLVVGLGGVSLVLHDPLFVMLKPSLVQLGLAVTFSRPGWLARYIRPERLAHIPARTVVVAGHLYVAAFLGLAAANLGVALTATPQAWALYSAVAPSVVFTILGTGLYLTFRGYVRRGLAAA